MLSNVSSDIFSNSSAIEIQPIISAEWNHNLFNTPYVTVAGPGTIITPTLSSGTVTTGGTDTTLPCFNINNFILTAGSTSAYGNVVYTASSLSSPAYKIVTYFKTNNNLPVSINAYAKGGSATQSGSAYTEVNSYGWTKLETYVGGFNSSDTISSLTYTISVNSLNSDNNATTIYFTPPQILQTTFFDYQNNSLWQTDSAFTYFRPGESYVTTGNINVTAPSNFRKITRASSILNGFSGSAYAPISSISQSPSFTMAKHPLPMYKNALPNEMAIYKYFVSDTSSLTSPKIAALYAQNINVNKIVIKFNTLMSVPTFNLYIDGSIVTVDGSTTLTTPTNSDSIATGVLVLYWTGSAWTKTKWSTMPAFDSSGALSTYTSFKKISITQTNATATSQFSSYSNSSFTSDLTRMQLIELSPRLEIDVSDFVKDVTINKSLDSKNNFVPISSINANDVSINLSAIPVALNNGFIPIFSSQSNLSTNVLANMLRKNIKFYVNFTLKSYYDATINNFVQLNVQNGKSIGTHIPGGIFYSDSWDETDIKDVKIVAYDITRYLQTTAVSDYVANLKPVFDVITNMLDLSGFTDYDVDSLYDVCNDYNSPLDLAYFYTNGRDTTIVDTLAEIFLAYQIGAYIDEYGVMKFKSLSQILNNNTSSLTISDSSILQGGYSIINKAKPGKLSLRYQIPKIKQTLAMQNVTNPDQKESPSFIITTSTDIMWSQETSDAVGFNYLNSTMQATDNFYTINTNDLLDIFHTFNLNNNGYAVIEDELVSFVYKEYKIQQYSNSSNNVYASVKNDLELNSEVNRFVKKYASGLVGSNYGNITNASGNGTTVTFTCSNNFKSGQKVYVSGVTPAKYNGNGKIVSANSTTFTVAGTATGSYISGGQATVAADYDVVVTPTGRVTNTQRGLFGTVPKTHSIVTGASSKSLIEASINSSNVMSTGTTRTSIATNSSPLPNVTKLAVTAPASTKCLVYPSSQDIGYHTYSVKFDLTNQQVATTGLFFNNDGSTSSGTYFVELLQYNTPTVNGGATMNNPAIYQYMISISQIVSGTLTQIAWADVTGTVKNILLNNEKVFSKNGTTYTTISDDVFHLKAIHWTSDGTDATNSEGENTGQLIKVFLNNVQVTGFQVPGGSSNTYLTSSWQATDKNLVTGLRKNVVLNSTSFNTANKYFGFCTSTSVYGITGGKSIYSSVSSTVIPANLREIYANEKVLSERSVNYWYQDREFLNGVVQKQNIFGKYRGYMMQTTPEIVGINIYDIQYTNPAAVTADTYWGGYLLQYYPGSEVYDQAYKQQQVIDEYGLSFSTILNTGFRAKFAVANNKRQMVYLAHKPDTQIQVDSRFTIWTHEIVSQADPQILEKITDRSNISEVAQIDSIWIQSEEAANKLLRVIEKGFDGFSKDTTIQLFGNPLIQVGDVVTINYSLSKLNQQKYAVHSVSQAFNQGLKTTLVLNQIDKGVSY